LFRNVFVLSVLPQIPVWSSRTTCPRTTLWELLPYSNEIFIMRTVL
jgi:hypothetical protein